MIKGRRGGKYRYRVVEDIHEALTRTKCSCGQTNSHKSGSVPCSDRTESTANAGIASDFGKTSWTTVPDSIVVRAVSLKQQIWALNSEKTLHRADTSGSSVFGNEPHKHVEEPAPRTRDPFAKNIGSVGRKLVRTDVHGRPK